MVAARLFFTVTSRLGVLVNYRTVTGRLPFISMRRMMVTLTLFTALLGWQRMVLLRVMLRLHI